MDTQKVKGTMLADIVRMIRKNKDKNWGEYLKPEDWDVINRKILDSAWYPLELYTRFGLAAFEILANGDPRISYMGGQIRGEELFKGVYKSIIIDKYPMKSLHRFVGMYGLLFNFSVFTIEDVGENHVKIFHKFDRKNLEKNIPYCHHLMGLLDTLIEMTGGKDIKIELTAKQWENAPATIFGITWK